QKFPVAASPQAGQDVATGWDTASPGHRNRRSGGERTGNIDEDRRPESAVGRHPVRRRGRPPPPSRATVGERLAPDPMTAPSPDTIDLSSAAHMGGLARGGTTWSVYLETRQDGPINAGRVHFVAGDVRRSSAW